MLEVRPSLQVKVQGQAHKFGRLPSIEVPLTIGAIRSSVTVVELRTTPSTDSSLSRQFISSVEQLALAQARA